MGESWGAMSPWGGDAGGPARKHRGTGKGHQEPGSVSLGAHLPRPHPSCNQCYSRAVATPQSPRLVGRPAHASGVTACRMEPELTPHFHSLLILLLWALCLCSGRCEALGRLTLPFTLSHTPAFGGPGSDICPDWDFPSCGPLAV